ncbi:hypothetical protein D6C89_07435 [Aureobasidium pullulans]|nr:hypothetical protein D6C89_07435 [Aureobasidium pullulans]
MVVMYNIMGRQVGSHHLALGILTSLFAGIGYASSGGSKKITGSTPPINASSKDEADFIQYVASFVLSSGSERARNIGYKGQERPEKTHYSNHTKRMLTSCFHQQAVPQGEREEGGQALDSGSQEIIYSPIRQKSYGNYESKPISCVYIFYTDVPLHKCDDLAQGMSFELMKPDSRTLDCFPHHILHTMDYMPTASARPFDVIRTPSKSFHRTFFGNRHMSAILLVERSGRLRKGKPKLQPRHVLTCSPSRIASRLLDLDSWTLVPTPRQTYRALTSSLHIRDAAALH